MGGEQAIQKLSGSGVLCPSEVGPHTLARWWLMKGGQDVDRLTLLADISLVDQVGLLTWTGESLCM